MRLSLFVALLLMVVLVICLSDQLHAGAKKGPLKTEKQPDKEAYLLVVPPAGGKEVKLIDWRFSLGTRRLSFSKSEPALPKAKTPTGPEYLEFREEKSTTYQIGILTLIPINSISKIEYDRDKKAVSVAVVKPDNKEEILTGTTKFLGINKLTLEGDAVLEGLGAATVKFQGGTPDGIRSVRFPQPEAVEQVKDAAAAVIIAQDKEKTPHAASGLQPLYFVDGTYRVMPYLMFKKTVKIDMDKIAKLQFLPSNNKKQNSSEYELTLRDGNKHTLTLLTTIELEKKKLSLVGLLGSTPVGYKLFPPHTIQELRLAGAAEKK